MEGPLSTDVVMGIVMSHLNARDLLNCRKVSKFWNKIASSALRKRSTMIKNISSEEELMELGKCMRESSDFPFAGLTLTKPWRLSSAGAIEFFRNHGQSFRRLYLGTKSKTRLEDLEFMNHLPRLSILEVSSPWGPTPDALEHAGQADGSILNLPSLRALRISSEINPDFLRQVCTAASPSLQIECLNATCGTLKALERVGKLQAVSVLKIYEEFEWDDNALLEKAMFLSTELLTLTKLDFNAHGCIPPGGLKKILISSQHTLKDLRLVGLTPSEFLSECPVLTKLTTLSLCMDYRSHEYFFQDSQGHKFSALKEMKLDIRYREYNCGRGHFTDTLFIVPSLTTMDLNGRIDIKMIKDFARSFPNVVEIRLRHRYFGDNPSDIWSVGAFKFLEKLKIWDYPVRRASKKYMNIDRFLTGIPNSICENLRKHAQQNLIDSPFISLHEILRKSPSILQINNLTELAVCVKLDDKVEEFLEVPPFISMVSVWYALQMMPNLKAKFLYDYSEPSWGFKEENREQAVAVLQAAFKHVQPYVELEPFFC